MKKFISILSILLIFTLTQPITAQAAQLIPGGQLIGLELQDQTVTVAAFSETESAAKAAGMQIGDRITHIDSRPVSSIADIRKALTCSEGSVLIRFLRQGKEKTLRVYPTVTAQGPQLGVYLRQGITGVGTVTYYDPQTQSFGALGHSVNDPSGKCMEFTGGNAYTAGVLHIKKGQRGKPGQIMGSMQNQTVGNIYKNTPQGVFGKTKIDTQMQALETADAEQVHVGPAVIRSTVGNAVAQEYSVKILKIYPASRTEGRNMLLKVTDERLLETTGGIVQGMSGSPIIQDGKLVGAVTHVLVNDPTTGYGIFIGNMLSAAE